MKLTTTIEGGLTLVKVGRCVDCPWTGGEGMYRSCAVTHERTGSGTPPPSCPLRENGRLVVLAEPSAGPVAVHGIQKPDTRKDS